MQRSAVYVEHLARIIYDRDAITEATARRLAAVAIATMPRPPTDAEQQLATKWQDIESRARVLLHDIDKPGAAVERFVAERLENQRRVLKRVLFEAEIVSAMFRSWTPSTNIDLALLPDDLRLALGLKIRPGGENEPSVRDQFIWLAHHVVAADPGELSKGERTAFVAGIAQALGISRASPNTIKRDLSAMRGSDARLRVERLILGSDEHGRPLPGDLLETLDRWYRAYEEWRAHVSLVGCDPQAEATPSRRPRK